MRKRTILTASAIIAVGVIAVPTAANAANGGSWLLGRSNYESAATTVSNSAGTPLSLKAKSGYAPLAVNSSKTVTNLSADKLDGLSSSWFARSTAKSAVVSHDGSADGLGAKCPTGTIALSGGGYDPYGWPVAYSGPDFDANGVLIPNSWLAMDEMGYSLVSFVTCVNLSGAAVPGALTNINNAAPSSAAASVQGLTPTEGGAAVPGDLLKMRAKAQDAPKPERSEK